MESPPLCIRRARRTDFTAVMALLAAARLPLPPPDRATLRRFRNIAADLGADLYVAELDGRIGGLVHVSYSRQLGNGQRARIEQLVVAEEQRQRGLARALVDFAAERARKRACASLSCVPEDAGVADPAELVEVLKGTGTERFADLRSEG